MIPADFIAAVVSLSVGAFVVGYGAGLVRAYLRRVVAAS
jgi:hypothetical protein